jgi:iron(III) transport system permease protein
MHKLDNLDVTAKLVLAVVTGAAIYLIAVPLAMLLFAAFRGPADYLPFEPGARWTLEHVQALFTTRASCRTPSSLSRVRW